MSKEQNYDPFMLDQEAHKKLQNQMKGVGGSGIFCPKRNLSIGGLCSVCNVVAKLFSTGDKKDRDLAFLKMAKASFFLNAVFRDNPTESTILMMGKKAGNQILEGISLKGWKDIAHPHAGKGREMTATKSKGDLGFPAYSITPELEKADWEIPEEVLKSLPNLDNIIEILKSGSHEIKKLSELEMNQSMRFRICPAWDNDAGNKRIMTVVWQHFGGITQKEVDGDVPVDLSTQEASKEKPTEQSTLLDSTKSDTKRERCFGMESVYEEDNPLCKECKDYKDCGEVVNSKADDPF